MGNVLRMTGSGFRTESFTPVGYKKVMPRQHRLMQADDPYPQVFAILIDFPVINTISTLDIVSLSSPQLVVVQPLLQLTDRKVELPSLDEAWETLQIPFYFSQAMS